MNLRTNLDESGSIAPLGIGLATLAIAALLTTTAASSAYLFERRLQSVSDAATIAVAAEVLATPNTYSATELTHRISARLHQLGSGASVARAFIQDGLTLEVQICELWRSPVPNPFGSPEGRVCAESKARLVDPTADNAVD